MSSLGIVIAIIFVSSALLLWGGLFFGSRWVAKAQTTQARHAASALEKMFIFTDAKRIIVISVIAVLAVPLAAWLITSNVVIVVAAVVAALIAPKFTVKYLAKRRLELFEQQLPDALLMITGALRAGASLPIALESVTLEGKPPVSQEFELLLRELRLGVDFTVALRNLERRVPLEDLVLVTAGMALAREVGANLAETLDSIAKTIRQKLQMEGKIRSLTAQGKMQGLVMAGLPWFLIAILRTMEPEAMAPLFNAWYGWVVLAIITVATFIGHFFIRKITTIDV